MKTSSKLVLAGMAGVLSAAIALVLAIDAPPPDMRAPVTAVLAGGAAAKAPWGHDVLQHQPAPRASNAKPIVAPGLPAFSPPLATQRVLAPPPARTTPPKITMR